MAEKKNKENRIEPLIVSDIDMSGTYNYSDYYLGKLGDAIELIRGKIFRMAPAPSLYHQKISMSLLLQIGNFFKPEKCQVFHAPFDIRFTKKGNPKNDKNIDTVLQPDICVICDLNKLDDRGCIGAPDWVIEILSPGEPTI